MVKTYIFIFSFLLANSVLPESISRKNLNALKENCLKTYSEKKYKEAIPLLEKYISFQDEVRFKILLAKSILFQADLIEPKEKDEIFIRQERIHTILAHYKKAAKIFAEATLYIEKTTPKDKSLGDLYFLWALSEQFSNEREKAIGLYKKSALLKKDLAQVANYNIGAIYDSLGQTKESEIYFSKYAKDLIKQTNE